jgi:hypothetical protein
MGIYDELDKFEQLKEEMQKEMACKLTLELDPEKGGIIIDSDATDPIPLITLTAIWVQILAKKLEVTTDHIYHVLQTTPDFTQP